MLPKAAFVRINGKVLDLTKQSSITLSPGTYRAEIWAPRFSVVTKSIELTAGKNEVINLGLKNVTDAYLSFQEKMSAHRTAKLKRSLSGGTLVAANAGLAYYMFLSQLREGRELEDKIAKLQQVYTDNTSFTVFGFIRTEYQQTIEKYEEVKNTQATRSKIGIPLVGLTTAATVYLFYRRSKDKLVKPGYVPSNPFVGALLSAEPSVVITENHNAVGFTFKF